MGRQPSLLVEVARFRRFEKELNCAVAFEVLLTGSDGVRMQDRWIVAEDVRYLSLFLF